MLVNVDNIEVVDDYTVRFDLKSSATDFPDYADGKIISKNAYATMDAKAAGIIGTGPYTFDAANTQSSIQFTCKRYDNYWDGIEECPTKYICCKYINDENTRSAAVQAGELNICNSGRHCCCDKTKHVDRWRRFGPMHSRDFAATFLDRAFNDAVFLS